MKYKKMIKVNRINKNLRYFLWTLVVLLSIMGSVFAVTTITDEIINTPEINISGNFIINNSVFFVNSTLERVGIGTTSPDEKLHVNSLSGTSEDILVLENDINNADEFIGLKFQVVGGLEYGAVRSYLGAAGDSYMSFLTTTDSGSNLVQQMTIQHDGNVGIGTDSPDVGLHLIGNQWINGGLFVGADSNDNPLTVNNPPDGELWVVTNNRDTRFLLGEDSGAGEWGGMKWIRSDNTLRVYTQAGGEDQIVLDGSGNVGINTTTPQNKLNVIGNMNITGTSYLNNVSFNGGWENDGVSILDGDIYAQTGYFYNITSLNVSRQNLTVIEDLTVGGDFNLGDGIIRFNDTSNKYIYYNGSAWQNVDENTNVPAGAIMAFNSATCPNGWIPADGTSGTPDLRGRTIIGTGTGTDINSLSKTFTFNETGGEYNHTLTEAEMPAHTHIQNVHGHAMGRNQPFVVGGAGIAAYNYPLGVDFHVSNTIATNQNTGGDASHSVIQPYRTLTYCMKTSEDSETSNTLFQESGGIISTANASHSFVGGMRGEIKMYGGSTAPTGWLLCNGTNYSRTGTYANLYTVLGTTYGNNSANDFKIPDMRGKYVTGTPNAGTLGGGAGTALTDQENRAVGQHTHTQTQHRHFAYYATPTSNGYDATVGRGDGPTGSAHYTNYQTPAIQNAGSVAGTNAPYLQLNFIIKY